MHSSLTAAAVSAPAATCKGSKRRIMPEDVMTRRGSRPGNCAPAAAVELFSKSPLGTMHEDEIAANPGAEHNGPAAEIS